MRLLPTAKHLLVCLIIFFPVSHSRSQEESPTTSEEVRALRREVAELREQLQRLREQVASLTEPRADAEPPAPGPLPPPAPPPGPVAPTQYTVRPNLMNPAISANFLAIGNTSLSRESETNGFDLSEAEFAFQSVVDPYARVDLFLTFPVEESPEVEEGFVSTLSLPASLQLKGGRFKNTFGKWNILHSHAFFTVEQPDPLFNFFGEESFTTDGLSLSWLIPNPWDLYLESVTEIGTALEGVSFNSATRDMTWMQHVTAFFDTSPDGTLEVGVSAARGRTGPSEFLQESLEETGLSATLQPREELNSMVVGLDLTYKWKPLRQNIYRSFLWQTEILRSRQHVDELTPAGTLEPESINSLGAYTYLEWQFARRWRSGLRCDFSGFPDSDTARMASTSSVIRFQPSEFHEIRFQVKHSARNDEAALRFDGETDETRIFLEWIPVIGAHGAHKY